MWKKLGIGVAVLILIIAGAAWYLFANLDYYIEAAIEKYGSAATRASLTIDSVKLSLASGAGQIYGLVIGNPPGFLTPYALSLGSIAVQLDTASIHGTGPIIINEIDIIRPHIIYEVRGAGGLSLSSLNLNSRSNLAALQSNVKAYAAGQSGNTAATPSSAPQRREIIRRLFVRDGTVSIATSLLRGRTASVALPLIHLTNIGQTSGGATAAELGSEILTAITTNAALSGAAELMKNIGAPAIGPLGHAVSGKVKSLF